MAVAPAVAYRPHRLARKRTRQAVLAAQHVDDEKIVIKLFKAFEGGGILHVGFEVRDRPGLFAGISLPW